MRDSSTHKLTIIAWVLGLSLLGWTQADDLTQEQIHFFEAKIRPVLIEHCYECHSHDEKIRGGLALDSKEGLFHGGDSGEAVVPGDLEASLLWTAVTWDDPDYEMPPRRKLPDSIIKDIEQWILMGAPDPRVTETVEVASEINIEEGREFWSFQPPVESALPEVSNPDWALSEVDHFVLAKLDEKGLSPVEAARPDVLLRRLSYDLIGLPPAPEEVVGFVKAWREDSKSALEAKVDELLARPAFGERWGRHWLDVSRYAESTGKELNMLYPHAWRYRDYVIDSLNADKPYDRFLKEQIAGDLLPIRNDEDWQENLIGTGFLALGSKGLNERDNRQFILDVADEQIDTMSQAMLGLTVSCARCHDHKSDPIPTADYYSMAGIFLSTDTFYGTVNAGVNRRATDLLILPISDSDPLNSLTQQQMAQMRTQLASAKEEQQELRVQIIEERRRAQMGDTSTANPNFLATSLRLNSTIATLESRLNAVDESGQGKTYAMGVQDRNTPIDATILVRGELDKPAQKVSRGFLQVLDHQIDTPEIPGNASGRLQLAEWIASEENPLTARVMVNRIWKHLFGAGLVTSVDNFGVTGQAPSHPELLDYLALSFMENDWSIKAMIRELVLTQTYQLSSSFQSAAYAQDPENVYLWRAAPKRIDAEALRDSILAASGQLDTERPKGSIVAELGDSLFGRRVTGDSLNRQVNYRSVYLPIVRDGLLESLSLFDGADPNIVNGVRDVTNVPSQALYLMNNPFVLQQGEAMARRLVSEVDQPRARFERAFFLAYGRPATQDESNSAMNFFRSFVPTAMKQGKTRENAAYMALSAFCQGLMASAEFRMLN